jgi:putative spermidine/putrescine transport system ATP-binding protein
MFHQVPDTMTTGAATMDGNAVAKGGGFLSLQALEKRYVDIAAGHIDVAAVDRIDLDVRKGEFVSLLGPSGCGKTTTLRMIAGLVPTTSGRIVVDGHDITAAPTWQRDIGLVFQSYALFPHMTVAANVAFGLEMRKLRKAEIATRVAAAIAMVRLEGREHRKPGELSGGQQQRVALARALVIRPSILLLDEPLSNLDAKLRDEMRNEIRDIQKRLGITTVFVTHDQEEALTMSDRIVVMNRGRIEQVGSPLELYRRPANLFVAGFIGSPRMNFVAGEAARRTGAATLGIRPEHLAVVPQGTVAEAATDPGRAAGGGDGTASGPYAALAGTVAHVERLGADSFVYVDVPEHGTLVARVIGDTAIAAGEAVALVPHGGTVHRFDGAGQALRSGSADQA